MVLFECCRVFLCSFMTEITEFDETQGQANYLFFKYEELLYYRKKMFCTTNNINIYIFSIKNMQILMNYVMFIEVEHVNLYPGTANN